MFKHEELQSRNGYGRATPSGNHLASTIGNQSYYNTIVQKKIKKGDDFFTANDFISEHPNCEAYPASVNMVVEEETVYTPEDALDRILEIASTPHIVTLDLTSLKDLLDPGQHKPDTVHYDGNAEKGHQITMDASSIYQLDRLNSVCDNYDTMVPIVFSDTPFTTADGRHRIAVACAKGDTAIKAEVSIEQMSILRDYNLLV